MINLSELLILEKDELTKLITAAKKELAKRNQDVRTPINVFDQLNTQTTINRRFGGWTKTVVGLDKTQTNGYSIIGDFVKGDIDRLQIWDDGLYLDCDIGGSWKNRVKFYTLFKITKNEVEVIAEVVGKDWAVTLWESIENNLE